MIANGIFVATIFCAACGVALLSECPFLIRYRDLILFRYGWHVTGFFAALFLNVAALSYLLGRAFFLQDTGRKLAHMEKQLRAGSISEELSERLREE